MVIVAPGILFTVWMDDFFIYPCGVPLRPGFVVQTMDTRRRGYDGCVWRAGILFINLRSPGPRGQATG